MLSGELTGVSVLSGEIKREVIDLVKEEQEKIVEAQKENVVVLPDDMKVLSKVTVKGVTAGIDENIRAENIKLGVNILGVEGNVAPDKPDQSKIVVPTTSEQIITADTGYELGSVTVGAIQTEEKTVIKNGDVIPSDGKYLSKVIVDVQPILVEKEITADGTYNASDDGVDGYSSVSVNVGGTDMLQSRVDETKSCAYLFYYYKGNNSNIAKNLNTTGVTSMDYMFSYCSKLTSLDVSNLDTSSVTNMSSMFGHCSKLTSLDVSNLDTSSVTSMNGIFSSCVSLTELDVSNFNTSKVTNISSMFSRCSKLTSLDVSNFDTSKVTIMSQAFQNCSSLQNIIGTIDLIKCTSLSNMFNNCTNLTTVTLKNIKANLQIGSGTSYGHLLTLDTLINTIKELWDYSSGTKTYTLTIGSANLEKIANTYVKLITPTEEQIAQDPNIESKKPCEVCESTDEGAMSLTEYVTSKRWSLA